MKKMLLTAVLAFIGVNIANAKVGIGIEKPETLAQLELKSTTRGVLLPCMSNDMYNIINKSVQGLMTYCTNYDNNPEAQLNISMVWTNRTGDDDTFYMFKCGDNVTFTYNGQCVTYGTIEGAGKNCWLDRNLGATQVAVSSTDVAAYGDLYQWGRAADGHQLRDSPIAISSGSVASGNEGRNFIISDGDWLSTPDDNRWNTNEIKGGAVVKTVDDPCPEGFRTPTKAEWQTELDATTNITNPQSAWEILRLPMAGSRCLSNGSLGNVGTNGLYWSSSASSTFSLVLLFSSSDANMFTANRANGFSVRCIKE